MSVTADGQTKEGLKPEDWWLKWIVSKNKRQQA